MNWRTSARVILDARQNTAYGTLRAYMVVGVQNANHANAAAMDAAFLQFAGFTAGYTNSFYSFAYGGYGIVANPATDWSWTNVFAYTAELGNGVTASISAEDPRGRRATILSDNGVLYPTAASTTAANLYGFNHYGGSWAPDVVGNINVTQAWGRAQIMGAVHQVKPNGSLHNDTFNPGAESKYGYAVGAGIEVKTPQTGNANNSFIAQGTLTKGATDYTGYNSSPTAGAGVLALSHLNGTGPVASVGDAFYDSTTDSMQLIKAWSVYGAYRHYWTPALRTSFAFGYLEIDRPNVTENINNPGDIEVMQAGASTVWSPVTGLDLSLDLVYSQVEVTNAGFTTAASLARNGRNDIWTAWTRIRRNF